MSRDEAIAQVTVETLAFDFRAATVEEYAPLLEIMEQKEIGILVNNVGCAFCKPEVRQKCGNRPHLNS